MDLLETRCNQNNETFHVNDRKYFFGIYAANPKNFQILLGDRKLLKKSAEKCQEIFSSRNYADYLMYFAFPNQINLKRNTDNLSPGVFFGKKDRTVLAIQANIDENALQNEVYKKVQSMFRKFDEMEDLIPVNIISKDLVKIVDSGSEVRADVICIFCPKNNAVDSSLCKPISVPYESRRGTAKKYWNYGNLNKHLQRHKCKLVHIDVIEESLTENGNDLAPNDITCSDGANDEMTTQSKSDQLLVENLKIDESFVSSFCADEKTKIYNQFASQNLRLAESVMLNGERKKVMVIKNPDDRFGTVAVINIPGDGNCCFSSCVHQIYQVKVGSKKFNEMVAQLRKDVVKHIETHFDHFKQAIKTRLEDENKLDMKSDINEQCKIFVRDELSKPGYWGAHESVMAISEIHKVNIVTFAERGAFYFATGFNSAFDRFIFLAYRGYEVQNENGEKNFIFNHYETICEISPEQMYTCVTHLLSVIAGNGIKKIDLE